eukprot:7023091-Prymnesium_polylepis.1
MGLRRDEPPSLSGLPVASPPSGKDTRREPAGWPSPSAGVPPAAAAAFSFSLAAAASFSAAFLAERGDCLP